MTDHFALLGIPRRPWLEPEQLKQRFLALSSELHPDRVHSAGDSEKHAAQSRYTDLNSAFQCLSRPKERLRHLLELETGLKVEQIQDVPSKLMDFLLEFSSLCRQIDAFLAQKSAAQSQLLRAQLFETSQEWTDKISATQRRLNDWRQELETELKQLDSNWLANRETENRSVALARLEEISRTLGYLDRWSAQAQERFVQLSL